MTRTISEREEISHKACQLTHICPGKSNYRNARWWQLLDLISSEFESQSTSVKLILSKPFQTHTKDGRWSRGPSARTSRRWFTRNWHQGAPKSFNLTAVNGCNATTAGCLRAKSPQNLWLQEKSQRDPWRIEHDRRQRCNVSHNSVISRATPFLTPIVIKTDDRAMKCGWP